MKNNGLFQAEYETKLNKVYLHLMVDKEYHEDYQMPMLRQNQIEGVLVAEGCFVEGKSRYTYEVGGLTSMAMMHEKASHERADDTGRGVWLAGGNGKFAGISVKSQLYTFGAGIHIL